MDRQPYRSAKRVFWVMDNGTYHRGAKSVERLTSRWRNIVPVHPPVHASWLDQIEIYFSTVRRKVPTPTDFASPEELAERLLGFQERYELIAKPFEWRFTRKDLDKLMDKISNHGGFMPLAA